MKGLMVFSDGENDRIAKKVYLGECGGSCSVSRLRKKWINNVKDYLSKRGLDVRQARRELLGFVRGGCIGNETLTLMKCHNYIKPLVGIPVCL